MVTTVPPQHGNTTDPPEDTTQPKTRGEIIAEYNAYKQSQALQNNNPQNQDQGLKPGYSTGGGPSNTQTVSNSEMLHRSVLPGPVPSSLRPVQSDSTLKPVSQGTIIYSNPKPGQIVTPKTPELEQPLTYVTDTNVITYFIKPVDKTPEAKPLTISESVYERSDAMRAKAGLPPLESQVPLIITSHPSGKPIEISDVELLRVNETRRREGLGPLQNEVSLIVVSHPSGKPLTISESVYERSDAMRAKAGLPPLESVVPLQIVSTPSGKRMTISESELIKSDQQRKELGLPPLESVVPLLVVSHPSGNPITVSENVLIKSDQQRKELGLPPLESVVPVIVVSKGPVNMITGVETTQTEYYRKNDNPVKSALATFAEPFIYTGLALESFTATLLGKNLFTGEDVPITKYNATDTENKLQTKVTSIVGPTLIDEFLSGDYNSSTMTPVEKVGSVVGTVASFVPWMAGGGAGSLSNRIAVMQTQKVAFRIGGKLREGELISKVSKPEDPLTGLPVKSSRVYEISQGTTEQTLKSYIVEEPTSFTETVMSKNVKTSTLEVSPGKTVKIEELIPEMKTVQTIEQVDTVKKVPQSYSEPTLEEIKSRYPLFGQGQPPVETTLKPVTGIEPDLSNSHNIGRVRQETGEGIFWRNIVYENDIHVYGHEPIPIHPSNAILIRPTNPEDTFNLVAQLRYQQQTGYFEEYGQGSVQHFITKGNVNDIPIMDLSTKETLRLKDFATITSANNQVLQKGDILLRRVGSRRDVGDVYFIETNPQKGTKFESIGFKIPLETRNALDKTTYQNRLNPQGKPTGRLRQETGEGIFWRTISYQTTPKTYGHEPIPIHPSNAILVRFENSEIGIKILPQLRLIQEKGYFGKYSQGSVQDAIRISEMSKVPVVNPETKQATTLGELAKVSSANNQVLQKGDILLRRVGNKKDVGDSYLVTSNPPSGFKFTAENGKLFSNIKGNIVKPELENFATVGASGKFPEDEEPVFGIGSKSVPVTRKVEPKLPPYLKAKTQVETLGQIGTEEPNLFPKYTPRENVPLLNILKSYLFNPKPGSENFKVISDTTNLDSLAFVNSDEINTIYLNASTPHKGAFTPVNVIDLISHETLHNAIQDVAGPEASSSLDYLNYAGPEETKYKLLNLGLHPSTLVPEFELTQKPVDDIFQENVDSFFMKQASIGKKTFEGQKQPKKIWGKVIEEVPTEVQLNLGGPAKKPLTVVGPESTIIVRSEAQDVLPPNAFLVTDITPGEAVHFGLEPVKGMKNAYFGEATAHNVDKLNELLLKRNANGVLEPELIVNTDYFKFVTKDIGKRTEVYGYATEHPEIYLSETFNDKREIYGPVQPGELNFKILEGKQAGPFAGIARPKVIRVLEGTKPGGFELKPQKGIDISKRPYKSMNPLDLSDMKQTKGSAGSTARSVNLMKDVSKSTNTVNPTITKEEPKSQGPTVPYSKMSKEEITSFDVDVLAYPSETKSKLSSLKEIDISRTSLKDVKGISLQKLNESSIQIQKSKTSQQSKQLELSKTIELTKSKQSTDTLTKMKEETTNKPRQDLIPQVLYKTGEDLLYVPLTRQITTQKQREIEIVLPRETNPPPNTRYLFPGFINFNEENKQQYKEKVGRIRRFFFSWNVNEQVVGGYLPGKDLIVSKTVKGSIGKHEKISKKWNATIKRGGKPPIRSRTTRSEKREKQTFSKLDKTVYKKPEKPRKGKWF